MNDIIKTLPKMKIGQELISALSVLPYYDERINSGSQAERLIALSEIYDIYIPSPMSVEIYSKLYLALLRSMQKKIGNNAIRQRNKNFKCINKQADNGILGGSDSFLISGISGIGKSSAINHAVELITENGIIEIQKPYTKIIPCVLVQCPFDSSVKGLLLEILRKIDEMLGSDYYTKALKVRATTDILIGSVSQIALNHIGLLIVDEIQNVTTSKNGNNLIGVLTQLINNSGISICMVGTSASSEFFSKEIQLARRSLGLTYNAVEYNPYFRDFCSTLFNYQYTLNKTYIDESILRWLYEHSGGIVSVVISLIHDSQEIAIMNGKEKLCIETLNEAYKKRLTMLHSYIEPAITRKSQTSIRKKNIDVYEKADCTVEKNVFHKCMIIAKENDTDILHLLQKHLTVERVKI